MREKPIVVNLFAGPGSGKSTGAAYIFSELKMNGVECELVREYIKDKVWERNTKVFGNQPYILGKQYHRMYILEGEVDVLITDSPLLLPVLYNTRECIRTEILEQLALDMFKSYDNMNYFINRDKPYNENGRNQTAEEAVSIDESVLELLTRNSIEFTHVRGNALGYDQIVGEVLSILED